MRDKLMGEEFYQLTCLLWRAYDASRENLGSDGWSEKERKQTWRVPKEIYENIEKINALLAGDS